MIFVIRMIFAIEARTAMQEELATYKELEVQKEQVMESHGVRECCGMLLEGKDSMKDACGEVCRYATEAGEDRALEPRRREKTDFADLMGSEAHSGSVPC